MNNGQRGQRQRGRRPLVLVVSGDVVEERGADGQRFSGLTWRFRRHCSSTETQTPVASSMPITQPYGAFDSERPKHLLDGRGHSRNVECAKRSPYVAPAKVGQSRIMDIASPSFANIFGTSGILATRGGNLNGWR